MRNCVNEEEDELHLESCVFLLQLLAPCCLLLVGIWDDDVLLPPPTQSSSNLVASKHTENTPRNEIAPFLVRCQGH